jgi:CRP-like cAMP-binding protein
LLILSRTPRSACRYYEYIWARYGGIDEAEVLGNLPKSLRSAVANHVLGPLLDRIPFFDSCSEPMEQMIVSLFETRIFLEDDALMICGEVGQDMFIIEKGEVEITSADRSMTYAKLKDGDYVGESCFLELSKRTASAYALDYVDTYFLTRDNFLKVRARIYLHQLITHSALLLTS